MQEEKIDNSLEFLILASDGLWDVVINEVRPDFFFPYFVIFIVGELGIVFSQSTASLVMVK